MSPLIEPTVLDLRKYSMRHIGPAADVWPTSPAPLLTLLGCTTMVARPIPVQNLPNSPDFASGQWTGRLNDAGDFTLTWPNATASDGLPWRERFDPTGLLQWIEITVDEYLEANCLVVKTDTQRDHIDASGYDGFWLLKKAYERDWTVVKAPRDVIERATQVWVPVTADNFPPGALNPQWTPVTTSYAGSSGSVTIGASGGCVLATTSAIASSGNAGIYARRSLGKPTSVWSAQCTFSVPTLTPDSSQVDFLITEDTITYDVDLVGGTVAFSAGASLITELPFPVATQYAVTMTSDGEWVWAFCNGQLVGCVRRSGGPTSSLSVEAIVTSSNGTALTATVLNILIETLQPFLMAGTDKGDYVLPGSTDTYPSGGLHARYYNDLDLQSDSHRLQRILSPDRSIAYAGSGPAEYQNQQDATINGQQNPLPGAATSNWSCKWFGSIWLPLSRGTITLALYNPTALNAGNSVARYWVGKTQFGQQLADNWSSGWTTNWDLAAYVTGASLAGSLPYGAGTVSRDGWYPIIVEYAVDSTAGVAPSLYFQVGPSFTWTDPGGTVIDARSSSILVPATSLSPLGCTDNRFQGISHFDLVQQTAQAVGYQVSLEPYPLETLGQAGLLGYFPGVLAPRLIEGHATDVILEPDDTPRAEGIINYGATVDATDQAASIQGNGAGFQNGTVGQLQANVYDPPTLLASLFDLQDWQDSADASYLDLLAALLNSELTLRLAPWEIITGDPIARQRLADTWPLTGIYSQMRWRPGDSVRVQAQDINVWDDGSAQNPPRQLLLVTRNISPNGAASTKVGFAARPKSAVYANRKALSSALRPQRNYQRQLVELPGTYIDAAVVAPGAQSTYSMVALSPSDLVVRARLRIAYITGTAPSVGVYVNNVDATSTLNGPWLLAPVNLEITPSAVPDTLSRLYVTLKNLSANSVTVSFQILIDLLR